MRGSQSFSARAWLRRRSRSQPLRLRCTVYVAYALLSVVVILALRWPYHFLREHVAEVRADYLLHAAQAAAQRLKSLRQPAGVHQCFGASWKGRILDGDLGNGFCSRVNDLLVRLRAAGPVMPMQGDGNEYNRTGVCTGGCFVAGNLRDAQLVMPNYIYHLAHVLSALREHGNPCFVSIYESGSHDRTAGWLRVLGDVLDAIGVPYTLKLNGAIARQAGEERIHFLARVRAAALEPLFGQCAAAGTFCPPPAEAAHGGAAGALSSSSSSGSSSGSGSSSSGRVVFLNDVLFAAGDVLRLLQYPADLVCGLDLGMAAEPDLTPREHRDTVAAWLAHDWGLPRSWARALSRTRALRSWWRRFHKRHERKLRSFGPLYFYDKWVARDISGRMFTNRAPYVAFPPSVARVVAGRPVRVHCCWNGLAVIGAEPLLRRQVRFRQHGAGECAASECSLLCDDLWRQGRTEVLLDPNVRVSYDLPGASRLYRGFTSEVPLGAPGLAYLPFRRGDVAEVLALPRHADLLREGGAAAGGGGGPRSRQVDCCDLKPGADMVEFREAGVCHNATVVLG